MRQDDQMRLAILGSGSVGRALAVGLTAAGHDTVLASRDTSASDLAAWADSTGIALAVPTEAVVGADIVLNATPGNVSVDAVRAAALSDGGVLLDLSNPLDFSSGAPSVFTGLDRSTGEELQAAFPHLRVVKSLCTVNNTVMVNPAVLGEPTTMFVAGDDSDAKDAVRALLTSLGWSDILDVGPIAAARQLELNILFWLRIYGAVGTEMFNIKVVRAPA
jgi:predicted dinucleotide-binding enzyme